MKQPLSHRLRFRTPKIRFFSPVNLIISWFGAGFFPISGTVGSLAALPCAWWIVQHMGKPGLIFFTIVVFLLGWGACDRYLKRTGGTDPSEVVVDEIVGQWIVLWFLPTTLAGYLVGFMLFRFFDIVKPWPVSWADQKIPLGIGVMMDDIFAAFYPPLIVAIAAAIAYAAGLGDIITPMMHALERF